MATEQEKVNILLVDDQPAKLISYEVMLSDLNENLVKASSARAAFEYLLKNDVAVVLVDVCMPELDGFELAAMIREHPRFERTAIIFVSAIHMADDDRLRGYRMGAVDYMPVPIVPDILRAKVKVFAELYRKTRQLEDLNQDLEFRVSERTRQLETSNTRLRDSESRRTVALAAGQMGAWDWDLETNTHHWDEEQFRILGVDPDSFVITAESIKARVDPQDWDKLVGLFAEARQGRVSLQFEVRFRRADGELRWCAVTAAASFDGQGQLIRLSGVTTDITERKHSEERHILLAREVDHRAKNALALVQSILRLTRADTTPAYVQAVEGRIAALSHAHTLLSDSRWKGANLKTLIDDELAPYTPADSNQRISIEGLNLVLEPAMAQSLALIVHELATNSAKYGALSAGGKLQVRWHADGEIFRFSWVERDGPATKTPTSKGFGIKVINSMVEGQLHGQVNYQWLETGLRCDLAVPLSAQIQDAQAQGASAAPTESGSDREWPILLVEDEVVVGLMMHEMLHDLGFSPTEPFGTVSGALGAVRSKKFSAAILDVNLRGEFVYDVADALLRENTPFVFVTGYAKESIEKRFGDIPVLRKPVNRESLHQALRTCLEGARKKNLFEPNRENTNVH